MNLLVGLGNPGKEYTNTRHNVGFLALDLIADSLGVTFSSNNKFKSEIATAEIAGSKVILAKPVTFMNLSGSAVQLICHYYKISIDNLIVVHDDIDLTLGDVRMKKGGSSAGHNGLKSIDSHLGVAYHRVRIGVGRPEVREEVADYVLQNFSKDERVVIDEILHDLRRSIPVIISNKSLGTGI